MTLEKVERQQAGVYQCTADNNVGEPVTVDMRLDVLCKSIIFDNFFLHCKKALYNEIKGNYSREKIQKDIVEIPCPYVRVCSPFCPKDLVFCSMD